MAFAEEVATIDSGNNAWMMVSTALVLLMTPVGLALFYAGMTRSKKMYLILMQWYLVRL